MGPRAGRAPVLDGRRGGRVATREPRRSGPVAWAWEDEASGELRSRYFPTDLGIIEDEATGAAAVVMGDRIGRPLTIRQGVGSELMVRPDSPGSVVEVGGRCRLEAVRDYGA